MSKVETVAQRIRLACMSIPSHEVAQRDGSKQIICLIADELERLANVEADHSQRVAALELELFELQQLMAELVEEEPTPIDPAPAAEEPAAEEQPAQ